MSDCLFCRMVQDEIPCDKVYEDDDILAFKDINPQAPTHVLVIPKKHISSVMDMKEDESSLIGRLIYTASKIAASEGIDNDGFRLVTNHGEAAGQTVRHIHLHLLGGRQFGWPPG